MNRDGSRIRDISPSGRKSSQVQVTVKDELCLPLVVVSKKPVPNGWYVDHNNVYYNDFNHIKVEI